MYEFKKITLTEKDQRFFEVLEKQGGIANRALYVFQRLFLIYGFKELVFEVRDTLDLPKDGLGPDYDKSILDKYLKFEMFVEGDKFVRTHALKLPLTERVLVQTFIKKHDLLKHIPEMRMTGSFLIDLITEYIFMNGTVGHYKNRFISSEIKYPEDNNDTLELVLRVPISAKKGEVTEYINSFWEYVENAQQQLLSEKDTPRFKVKKMYSRDILIWNKYMEILNIPAKERKSLGYSSYVETEVIKQLQAESVLEHTIEEGTVRALLSELRAEIEELNN